MTDNMELRNCVSTFCYIGSKIIGPIIKVLGSKYTGPTSYSQYYITQRNKRQSGKSNICFTSTAVLDTQDQHLTHSITLHIEAKNNLVSQISALLLLQNYWTLGSKNCFRGPKWRVFANVSKTVTDRENLYVA